MSRVKKICCKAKTHPQGAGYQLSGTCSRNPCKDGYCRQHHPKERELRYKAAWEAREKLRKESEEKYMRCPKCNGFGKVERFDDSYEKSLRFL